MAQALSAHILTPEKTLFQGEGITSLLVPTHRGMANILPHHAPMMTSLRIGTISLFAGPDGTDRHFLSTSGTCRVHNNAVTVLAHVCEEAHEVDGERAQRALDDARGVLANRSDLSDGDILKYRDKIERALIRIALARSK